MSTFRVSPWVSYNVLPSNPTPPTMDEDVEMDAPQISILRDEESPPPQRKLQGSRRQKASPKKAAEFPYLPRPRKESVSDDEYDEPEEEEDQLIDDDDDMTKPSPSHPLGRPVEAGQKRKAPSKRKPRKSDKKADEDKKGKERLPQVPSDSSLALPMNIEPSVGMDLPTETTSEVAADAALGDVPQSTLPVIIEPLPVQKPPVAPKKKASPRKPPAVPRQRAAKVTNDKEKLKITIRPLLPPEEADAISEGGHTGTAASSPITTHFELIDLPDIELDLPPAPNIPIQEETISLENVPIPVYPLPTRPLPVQPPPKLNTGAAPVIPLDRTFKRVRHWRLANREIRGIAGGRWFARTWVGEKESEFAVAMAAAAKEGDEKGVLLPKGSSLSAPAAGKGSGKSKGSKNASLAASASASAAPSRDGSLAPDIPLSTSAVRAPTKMRMTLGPDEYLD